MATVKAVSIAATKDAIYVLDTAGRLWAYNQDAEWRLIELPEELPA